MTIYSKYVVLVGDVSVGKSSMIKGITNQSNGFPPDPLHIGFDFAIRSFQVDDRVAKLQIGIQLVVSDFKP